jgi:3-deoxy-D-manno-octulosonate 8-phosphate phosphatase (KDO 8-P phosphatase)
MVTRNQDDLLHRANRIRLLVTDVDGVLTDGGVYYSADGEMMKRFSVRDGMGVQRLRDICGIDTAILTGENSLPVARRAEKLGIRELHLSVGDKKSRLLDIALRQRLDAHEIAYIGDDVNDREAMRLAGLCACPSDAMPEILSIVHFHCTRRGGDGAFREFAEWIISSRL